MRTALSFLVLSFALQGCVGGTSSLSPFQIQEGYEWVANQWKSVLTNTDQDFADTRLTAGQIYVADVPLNGNSVPDWRLLGEVTKCGNGLCYTNAKSGKRIPLSVVRNSFGTRIGVEARSALTVTFFDGHFLLTEASGVSRIGSWQQTGNQIDAANNVFRSVAQQVSSVHKKRGGMLANAEFNAGLDTFTSVLTTSSSVIGSLNQQTVGPSREETAGQQVATTNQDGILQEQERKRSEERQRELERLRRETEARIKEERREREAYRASLAAGSSGSDGRPTCVPKEIGCDSRTGCGGQYAGLPQCP